jgi:Zn-dependent M28 family amino/carboxypeptidase
MEAARACRQFAFESTVRFIAVSAEEFGMYGSTNYARAARDGGRAIAAAVNGDMIGYPTLGDTARLVIGSYITRNRLIDSARHITAVTGSPTLVPFIDQTGQRLRPFAWRDRCPGCRSEGTAEEIWGGADPYYHKTTDTMDKLSFGLIHRGQS